MAYALRAGISYCETGGRFVFLDVARDRYFCLSERDEAGFRALTGGAPDDGKAVGERLFALGLIERAPMQALAPCVAPPRPADTLLDQAGRVPPPWSLTVGAAAQLICVRVRLRRQGLLKAARALETCRRRKPVDPARAAYATAEIASAFERLSLLVSPMDQCLPRSLALARMLYVRGLPAQFVIGVQLRPFSAHSWVQAGPLLLNERIDVAHAFTPILVV